EQDDIELVSEERLCDWLGQPEETTDNLLLSGINQHSFHESSVLPVCPESPMSLKSAHSSSSVPSNLSNSCSEPQVTALNSTCQQWVPNSTWVLSWKSKLPLQTIMRLLQVLVPQVEKICIDKGLTDESEILRFLQHGTLVGLLPVPHPILIRKYQANS
ncbi:cell wall biogenesis protein, partial [Halocaridina rubra]